MSVFNFLSDNARTKRLSGEDVYARLLKSAVLISTGAGWGSGVLVDEANRIVLTNHHVVNTVVNKPFVGPTVISGVLDIRSPIDKVGGRRCEVYPLEMYEGEQFIIEMRSVQIDSYLRVEDARGTTLARDDDSGGRLNARIVFNVPQNGVYRIIATSFGGKDRGRFILSVRLQGRRKRPGGAAGSTVRVQFPRFQGDKLLTDKKIYDSEARTAPESVRAKVLYSDEARDLALVQLDTLPAGAKAISLAKSSAKPGQAVHSVGNPAASGSLWVYTSGTVRSNPYQKEWISAGGLGLLKHGAVVLETQSPTNAGDSGGPLVNEVGELVAVTQGAMTKANAVNLFIDLSEVEAHARAQNIKYVEGKGLAAARQLSGSEVLKLADLLSHADAKVRMHAAVILSDAGPGTARRSRRWPRRSRTSRRRFAVMPRSPWATSVRRRRAALPQLTEELKANDREFRRLLLRPITAIGPKGTDLAVAVGGLLAEADTDSCAAGLHILVKLGGDALPALPALGSVLEGPDRRLRNLALDVLEQAGPAAAQLVPQMKKALSDADGKTRQRIVQLATSLKKGDEVLAALVPELVEGLKKDATAEQLASLKKIRSLGRGTKGAAKAVAELYRGSKDRNLRLEALKTLAVMHEGAEDAVPTLLRDLKDSSFASLDRDMHDRVKQTLVQIGPAAVKPLLKVVTSDKTTINRHRAVVILGQMGPGIKDLAHAELKRARQRETVAYVREAIDMVLKSYAD